MMRVEDREPVLHVDAELPAEDLTLNLYHDISALEPYGAGWPRPVFVTRNLRVVGEPRVIKERHLKWRVAGCDGRTHDAIWWGGAEAAAATPRPGARIELAYAVEQNTWRDETRLQLIVEDMKLVNSEL